MNRLCRPPRLAARLARTALRPAGPNRPSIVLQARALATEVPEAKDPTERDQITTLPNGVRVASEDLPAAFSGVGVYIDAGARFENEYLHGSSHIMDRLAFKSTGSRTAEAMIEAVEGLGGHIQCASTRESIMYQAATFNSAIPTAVGLLAETVRDPRLTPAEIAAELETAAYEITEIYAKPDLILPEILHMAAWKDNTLGNPLLCPRERLEAINEHVIRTYHSTFYTPERIVVAYAGVPHDEAVRLAERYFGDMKPAAPGAPLSRTGSETSLGSLESVASSTLSTASSSALSSSALSSAASASSAPSLQKGSAFLKTVPFFKSLSTAAGHSASVAEPHLTPQDLTRPAHYTGGFVALPPQPMPHSPNMPTFTHVQLAFEGLPIGDDDIYALATLQTLLGGGGSFSSGGPGKGMYSRLYTNVLNQFHWVESCAAFNHALSDSGLFGIAASCDPAHLPDMIAVMCRELYGLTLDPSSSSLPDYQGTVAGARLLPGHPVLTQLGARPLDDAQVARAKNQLRSSLLMNMESRMVALEDLGRQVQSYGRKVPVLEMTRRIAALTLDDLRRVATKIVGGLVENPGRGTGAPTVVLQEATAAGVNVRKAGMDWAEIQDMIYQWGLGRRK